MMYTHGYKLTYLLWLLDVRNLTLQLVMYMGVADGGMHGRLVNDAGNTRDQCLYVCGVLTVTL